MESEQRLMEGLKRWIFVIEDKKKLGAFAQKFDEGDVGEAIVQAARAIRTDCIKLLDAWVKKMEEEFPSSGSQGGSGDGAGAPPSLEHPDPTSDFF